MKRSVFFSYDHENAAIVRRFAQQVSLSGVELWIDEKKLGPGDHYTTRIFDGIYQADAYVIFISRQSVQSAWVGAELDFAMKRKIEGGRLQIIPVRLDDAEMPVVLSGLEYLDARAGVEDTAARLSARLGAGRENAEGCLAVVSVGFAMTDRTDVEIGPFNEEVSAADLAENRERLLQSMRKSAYGILMNFVSIEDFDFGSEVPWFKNGIYTEDVRKVAGSTAGSLREQVCIETTVFHPSEEKLDRLLRDRLEILDINEITFGFTVPLQPGETMSMVEKKAFRKIQEQYVILSYDTVEGAKIELFRDFYLSLRITGDVIRLKLSAKYDFQFAKHMKEFSAAEFLRQLLA